MTKYHKPVAAPKAVVNPTVIGCDQALDEIHQFIKLAKKGEDSSDINYQVDGNSFNALYHILVTNKNYVKAADDGYYEMGLEEMGAGDETNTIKLSATASNGFILHELRLKFVA